jgi:hypothetical protein
MAIMLRLSYLPSPRLYKPVQSNKNQKQKDSSVFRDGKERQKRDISRKKGEK